MKTDEYPDIILDFISKTLPDEEVNEFNNTITKGMNYSHLIKQIKNNYKHDRNLQKQIMLRKDLKTALIDIEETEDLISKIQKIYSQKTVRIPMYIKWAVAASFLLIAIFNVNNYYHRINSGPDKIYNNYYKRYYRGSTTRTSEIDMLKTARGKYEKGKFDEAILIFENIPGSINVEPEILFYKGLSYMEFNDFSRAIKNLEKLLLDYPQSTWANYGTWYLGLSYLKTGNKEKAIKLFTTVKEKKILNHEKASKVLKKLK